jgi:hypothetical protein
VAGLGTYLRAQEKQNKEKEDASIKQLQVVNLKSDIELDNLFDRPHTATMAMTLLLAAESLLVIQ